MLRLLPTASCNKLLGCRFERHRALGHKDLGPKDYELRLNQMMRKIEKNPKKFERHVNEMRGEEARDLF